MIRGTISPKTGLLEAFRRLVTEAPLDRGMLTVESDNCSGAIGIHESRYLIGAFVPDTGERGLVAIKTLLSLKSGTYEYSRPEGEFIRELKEQSLSIDLVNIIGEEYFRMAAQGPKPSNEPTINAVTARQSGRITNSKLPAMPAGDQIKPPESIKPVISKLDGRKVDTANSFMTLKDAVSKQAPSISSTNLQAIRAKEAAAFEKSKTKYSLGDSTVYADVSAENQEVQALFDHFGLNVQERDETFYDIIANATPDAAPAKPKSQIRPRPATPSRPLGPPQPLPRPQPQTPGPNQVSQPSQAVSPPATPSAGTLPGAPATPVIQSASINPVGPVVPVGPVAPVIPVVPVQPVQPPSGVKPANVGNAISAVNTFAVPQSEEAAVNLDLHANNSSSSTQTDTGDVPPIIPGALDPTALAVKITSEKAVPQPVLSKLAEVEAPEARRKASEHTSSMRAVFATTSGEELKPEESAKSKLKKLWDKHSSKVRFAAVCLMGLAAIVIVLRSSVGFGLVAGAEGDIKNKEYDKAISALNMALTIDPSSISAHYARAIANSKLNRLPEAIADYDAVLQAEPKRMDVLERQAAACLKSHDYDRVVFDTTAIIALDPAKKSIAALNNRAMAYSLLGKAKPAFDDYSEAISMAPKNSTLYVGRGDCYLLNRRYKEAITDFQKAISLAPKSADGYRGMASVYQQLKEYSDAVNWLTKALVLSPKRADLFTQRGINFAAQGLYDKAIDDYTNALYSDKNYTEAYIQRAQAYDKKGQHDRAIDDLTRLISVGVDKAATYARRGRQFLDSGSAVKAVSDFTEAINISPNDANLYQLRASAFARAKSYKNALDDFDRAIALRPNSASLLVQRAVVHNLAGNSISANTDFERAINLEPKNATAYLRRGEFRLAQNDYVSAIHDFNTALEISPDMQEAVDKRSQASASMKKAHPESASGAGALGEPARTFKGTFAQVLALGYRNLSRGNYATAIDALTQAVRMNPNEPSARRYLAHALLAGNRTDEALDQFNVLTQLNGNQSTDMRDYADALRLAGRFEDSIGKYETYIQVQPRDAAARCGLARAYLASGFIARARTIINDGLKNAATGSRDYDAYQSLLREIGRTYGGSSTASDDQND